MSVECQYTCVGPRPSSWSIEASQLQSDQRSWPASSPCFSSIPPLSEHECRAPGCVAGHPCHRTRLGAGTGQARQARSQAGGPAAESRRRCDRGILHPLGVLYGRCTLRGGRGAGLDELRSRCPGAPCRVDADRSSSCDEEELLHGLRAAVPEGVKVTVVAERGFADGKRFKALSEELGFEYVIGMRGDFQVTSARSNALLTMLGAAGGAWATTGG